MRFVAGDDSFASAAVTASLFPRRSVVARGPGRGELRRGPWGTSVPLSEGGLVAVSALLSACWRRARAFFASSGSTAVLPCGGSNPRCSCRPIRRVVSPPDSWRSPGLSGATGWSSAGDFWVPVVCCSPSLAAIFLLRGGAGTGSQHVATTASTGSVVVEG